MCCPRTGKGCNSVFWHKVLFGGSIVVNIILLWALVWGSQGISAYRGLKEECANLDLQLARLEERNIELSREIRLLQGDEKYIEKMLRHRRLNVVRDNEILYIFPDAAETAGVKPDEAKN